MATSSITDNIVIRDPEQLEKFADAVEAASKTPLQHKKPSVRMVTDQKELIQLMEKRRQLHDL